MSRNTRRLAIVKQVFANRELEFARRLGEFQSQLDQASKQLKLLRDHRDGHAATLRSSLATDPGRLQNQQAFQSRLNDAISQQELFIQRAETERNEIRQQWLARRRKAQAVEKLCKMRDAKELRDETAREQKQLDELSRVTHDREVDWDST